MRSKKNYVNKCKPIINLCKAKNVRLATSMQYLDATDTRLVAMKSILAHLMKKHIEKTVFNNEIKS